MKNLEFLTSGGALTDLVYDPKTNTCQVPVSPDAIRSTNRIFGANAAFLSFIAINELLLEDILHSPTNIYVNLAAVFLFLTYTSYQSSLQKQKQQTYVNRYLAEKKLDCFVSAVLRNCTDND